jgi:hypothetical protein
MNSTTETAGDTENMIALSGSPYLSPLTNEQPKLTMKIDTE